MKISYLFRHVASGRKEDNFRSMINAGRFKNHNPIFPRTTCAVLLIGTCLILCPVVLPAKSLAAPALQEGDIVFQTSRSSQSEAVQKATHSQYSHMGIIFFKKGLPLVFEASRTVIYTPLEKWAARGVDAHYEIARVRDETAHTPEALSSLRRAAKAFEGLPYDPTFEWSDSKMYCSELVWKIYKRALGIEIGTLVKLREFDLTAPAVQKKIIERYHGKPPLDEIVISPQAIFDSKLIEHIVRE